VRVNRLPATLVALATLALLALVAGCASKRVGYDGRPVGPDPSEVSGPTAAGPVLLRVALAEQMPKQRFSGEGPYRVRSGLYDTTLFELDAGDSTSAWCLQGRVMYANALQGGRVDWLVLEPLDPDRPLRWDGRSWRGALHVITSPADSASVTVINVVELEDYLAGVVPLEIGRGRPASDRAAVEAQAVAARTYAVAKLDAHRSRGFDLYADTRDQVYGGMAVEDPLATAAVAATRGLVLRRGERLVDTFFHANCGGRTAAKDAIWPVDPDPVLAGVTDQRPDGRPWCADGRGARWRQQWTWDELDAIVARSLPAYLDQARGPWLADAFSPSVAGADGRDPGPLHDLDIEQRSDDGRVAVLTVTTAHGVYHVRGGRSRWVLRTPAGGLLRSSWFDLEVTPGGAVMATGRGYGHGLGLCQEGAVARARAGQDARDILAHYYPGTRLEPLVASNLP
jgi:stage II sporulation protein D